VVHTGNHQAYIDDVRNIWERFAVPRTNKQHHHLKIHLRQDLLNHQEMVGVVEKVVLVAVALEPLFLLSVFFTSGSGKHYFYQMLIIINGYVFNLCYLR